MSRHNPEVSQHIREEIAEYVEQNGVTTLDDIADYVYGKVGFRPSKSTVTIVLNALNRYPTTRRVWVYRHNQTHE